MRSQLFWKFLITVLSILALFIIIKSFGEVGSVKFGLFESWFSVIIYGIVTLVWAAIFAYFALERRRSRKAAPIYAAVLVVLIIDALKTLLESVYFGLYSAGYPAGIPVQIGSILSLPVTSAIFGVINVITAIVVLWFIRGGTFEMMYFTERREHDLKKDSLRLSVMNRVAGVIASSSSSDIMFREVVLIIRELLGYDSVYIFTFEPDLEAAEVRASVEDGSCPVGSSIPLAGHPAELLLKGDEMVMIDDLAGTGFHVPESPAARSELCVPLRLQGKVAGALIVASESAKGISGDHAAILETASKYVSEAMEKFRLWYELDKTYKDAEENRNYLVSILSNMEERVSVIDKDYTIQFLNKKIIEETGAKVGDKCYSAFEGLDAPCGSDCSVEEIISKGKTGFEYKFQDNTESPYRGHWYKVVARPLRNPDGSISVIEVMRDITEEKESEDALKRANEEIAETNKNLEKTLLELKMTQEQLLHSEKIAALGKLSSGVAHEINNPLTAVVGYSELLLMECKDQEVRRKLQRIREGAQRAAKIVKNLLAFARKSGTEKEMLNIAEVLKSVADLRNYDLEMKNIALDIDLDPNLPLVKGNFQQLQQVFLNLILNAEQAISSFRDSGHISVKARFDQESFMARIEFHDDGPGVPKEELTKVFDPFFTTKEVGTGTGLGLSICYGIVKDHGGEIHVESESGKGASFILEIPVS